MEAPVPRLPHHDWDLAADGLRRCWRTLERSQHIVSDRLIDLAGISAGDTVLDVATGIGEPALTAARRVGPAGRVIAIDQSADVLEVARARAAELGIGNVDFRDMDADHVALPTRSLDAIVCRWGLMFLADLPGALGRMRACLRSGRRLAAAVWADAEDVPYIGVRRKVIEAFSLLPASVDPFSLSNPSRLRAALAAAGFAGVEVEAMTLVYEFDSADAYASVQRDLHGKRIGGLADLAADRQQDFWQAIADAAGAFARSDGVVRMPCGVLCATGRA